MTSKVRMALKTLWPRTLWTITERDGIPELVIWREWLGNAYNIVSLAGSWGRFDRQRMIRESGKNAAPDSNIKVNAKSPIGGQKGRI